MKKFISVLLVVCIFASFLGLTTLADDETTIFIKPSDFKDNLGTWTIVPAEAGSFGEIIKAPSTMKPGTGKSAFAKIEIPAEGEYKIWARARDYVGGMNPDGSQTSSGTRTCELSINGTKLNALIGKHGNNGFIWQEVGIVKLTKGTAELELIDTANYYARVEGIIFSTNEKLALPENKDDMEAAIKKYPATVSTSTGAPTSKVTVVAEAAPAPIPTPSSEKKEATSDFEPFKIKATGSGVANSLLRLVVPIGNFPFAITENSTAGYIIKGSLTLKTDKNVKVELPESVIKGNEMRADSTVLIVEAAKDFPLTPPNERDYNKYDMEFTISPPTAPVTTPTPTPTPKPTATPTPTPTAKPTATPKPPINTIRPSDEIAVMFNGSYLKFDVPPMLLNGRTLVPMRVIFEALGCKVTWDEKTETAIAEKDGRIVKVTIGSNKATINKAAQEIDQSAVLHDGRTLVPIRFVSEAFEAEVDWDEKAKNVIIKTK